VIPRSQAPFGAWFARGLSFFPSCLGAERERKEKKKEGKDKDQSWATDKQSPLTGENKGLVD